MLTWEKNGDFWDDTPIVFIFTWMKSGFLVKTVYPIIFKERLVHLDNAMAFCYSDRTNKEI